MRELTQQEILLATGGNNGNFVWFPWAMAGVGAVTGCFLSGLLTCAVGAWSKQSDSSLQRTGTAIVVSACITLPVLTGICGLAGYIAGDTMIEGHEY